VEEKSEDEQDEKMLDQGDGGRLGGGRRLPAAG